MDARNGKRFTIIGAGNAGHVFAGHLTMMGYSVCLFDVDAGKIATLKEKQTITMKGALEGEFAIDVITDSIEIATRYASCMIVILPTVYHRNIAELSAPFLTDGQTVILTPGATGGALEFLGVLKENNCTADITVAETNSMLYASRIVDTGTVHVFGLKKQIYIASIPARRIGQVIEAIKDPYPQWTPVANVLHTSLNNTTAMVHPLPMVLNAGRVESGVPFEYYFDGFTQSVSRVIEDLDAERLAIGKAFSIDLPSIIDWYEIRYGVKEKNVHDTIHKVAEYKGIMTAPTLNTRYIFEDIPTGLVPMSMIGKAVGVATPVMDATIELCNHLLDQDFRSSGRTMARLGIEGMSADDVVALVS